MAAVIDKKDRKIIPRWRTFRTTASLGELNAGRGQPKPAGEWDDFLADKLRDWKAHRTVWHATDLLGAAVVLAREQEVRDAAEFILSQSSGASLPARDLAAAVARPGIRTDSPEPFGPGDQREKIHGVIHDLRARVPDEPRNSMIWVDLGLAYTILGMAEQAERSVRVALALEPENRFVLRSAARFYVHEDDPAAGHRLLATAESTVTDPWLLAAEIAVAAAAKREPRFVKHARRMLVDSSVSAHDLTELAGSIATLELENGKHMSARKLFRRALDSPTENSVAQVEWASDQLSGLKIDPNEFKIPRLFEANAWDAYARGDWEAAFQAATGWLEDQPFSSRPAMLASFICLEYFEDYAQSEHILRRSLAANPDNPILLNDLAYACGLQGKLQDAEEALAKMLREPLDDPARILAIATGGLIEFRRGRYEQGRRAYAAAVEFSLRIDDKRRAAFAAINLARQATLSNLPDYPELIKQAENMARLSPTNDVLLLLKRLQSLQLRPRTHTALRE